MTNSAPITPPKHPARSGFELGSQEAERAGGEGGDIRPVTLPINTAKALVLAGPYQRARYHGWRG